MKTYSVDEVFDMLKKYKITTNKESIRRWLRTGTIKGYQKSKKEGWRVREEDLQQFIAARTPNFNTTNDVNEEVIREKMWFEIVKKNIFEGFIEIKKSRLKECIDHKGYSANFLTYCLEQLNQNKRGYATPRIPYLLDSFLYDSKKIKMDQDFELLEEKLIFALIDVDLK
jgi:hypothetical protein